MPGLEARRAREWSSTRVAVLSSERFIISLLLGPMVLYLAAVFLYPLLFSFRLSLFSYSLARPGSAEFVLLANYLTALSDPAVWRAVGNTVTFTVAAVGTELILGFALAFLLNRPLWGGTVFRVALLTPLMISPAVAAILWKWLLNPNLGLLNYLLGLVGVGPINWTGDATMAMVSLVLVDVWKNTSFMILILLAGLKTIPGELLEAARIDGASPLQGIVRVIVPLLTPVALVAVLFRTMDSLRVFDTIYILTGGGPGTSTESVTLLAYRQGMSYLQLGYASALSYILFALIGMVAVVFVRWQTRAAWGDA